MDDLDPGRMTPGPLTLQGWLRLATLIVAASLGFYTGAWVAYASANLTIYPWATWAIPAWLMGFGALCMWLWEMEGER